MQGPSPTTVNAVIASASAASAVVVQAAGAAASAVSAAVAQAPASAASSADSADASWWHWLFTHEGWTVFWVPLMIAVIGALATLIGALTGAQKGATLAFRLQRTLVDAQMADQRGLAAKQFEQQQALAAEQFGKQERQLEAKQWQADQLAAHKAMFCIMQQVNFVSQYFLEYIKPFNGSPLAFVQISPMSQLAISQEVFDPKSLDFMSKTVDGRQLLASMTLAQENYLTLVHSINDRSTLHQTKVQPVLDAQGIKEGTAYSAEYIATALGTLLTATLRSSTTAVTESTQKCYQDISVVATVFRQFCVEAFGHDDFLKYQIPLC